MQAERQGSTIQVDCASGVTISIRYRKQCEIDQNSPKPAETQFQMWMRTRATAEAISIEGSSQAIARTVCDASAVAFSMTAPGTPSVTSSHAKSDPGVASSRLPSMVPLTVTDVPQLPSRAAAAVTNSCNHTPSIMIC